MKKNEDRYNPLFLAFAKVTGALSSLIYFKTKVFYESDKRIDKKGAAVVISNHSKLIDYVLMLTVFPLRVMRYLIAEIMFTKNPFLSWILYGIGGIRVNRENAADAACLDQVEGAIRRGHLIGFFPEGRLNTDPDGDFLEFKTGAAYFALKHGLPVVPVYHEYKYGLLRRTHVMVGDPIDLKALFPGDVTPALIKEATAYLRKRMNAVRAMLKRRVDDAEEKYHKSWPFRAMSAYIIATLRPLLLLAFRPKFFFEDETVNGRTLPSPAIVVSNHTSVMDPPMLCAAFRGGKLRVVAGELLYEHAGFRWLLPRLGAIKIDRNAIDLDSFKKMNAILNEGGKVGIFPEGHINKDKSTLLPFKSGMILAAVRSGAPIIPVYILREYKILGPRQHILIGKPFEFDRTARITGEFLDNTAEELRMKMLALKAHYEKENENV